MFAFIIALACLLAFPAVAFAADLSVNADSTEVKVGDNVTLTVVVSGKNIAEANGSFTYDPAVLTYVSSNGGASDGYINLITMQKGGSSSLTAVIKFVASGEGNAKVKVTLDSVLDYGGQALEKNEASVKITVKENPSATDGGNSRDPARLFEDGRSRAKCDGSG